MCTAVFFNDSTCQRKIYFKRPHAKLPLKLKAGGVMWLPWGRHPDQMGKLPLGGWVRLDDILEGKWDQFFPKPVKLPVNGFIEPDIEGNIHYYPLVKSQFLQGMMVRFEREMRVYIVTVTPSRAEAIHDRWPKIVA